MTGKEKQRLLPYALGEEKAALVFKDAQVVDVFTRRVRRADVAVQDGWIVGVGSYEGRRELPMDGKFLAPGWVDAHVHLESSMVSPEQFAREVLPWGTAAVIADPHEIGNVAGAPGLRYLMDAAERAVVSIFFMLPSCVPLSSTDRGGAVFSAAEMREFLEDPRVRGLGEMMDYEGILRGDGGLFEKIALLEPRVIDGHAPGVAGKRLQAYRLGGVQTDHECSGWEAARERLECGMAVQIREGSAARNLEAIVSGLVSHGMGLDRCFFCSDDLHIEDVRRRGHIGHCVREAIRLGADPLDAFASATIRPAEWYGLRGGGAVAPGYRADLTVLDSLEEVSVRAVYHGGVPAEECLREDRRAPVPEPLLHSVRVPVLKPEALALPAGGMFPVIGVVPGELLTRKILRPLPGENGRFVPQDGLLKLVALQRHDGSGRMGVGVLQGFGLYGGAIASTVAHDSHNILAAGDSDEDLLLAIEELKRIQGGYVLASHGRVLASLPLPVAGLFTAERDADVAAQLRRLLALCREMGVPEGVDPFQNLSFLSLTVIPEIRLTDGGIVEV